MKMSVKPSAVLVLAWALLLLAGWVFISQTDVEASPPADDPALEFNVIATIPVDNDPRGITVVPESNKVYVANYLSGTVSIIDGETLTVTGVITGVPNANGAVYNPSNQYLYVSNHFEDKPGKVTIISTITDSVLISVAVYDGPDGLAYNSNNHKIYVADSDDNYISVIEDTTPVDHFPLDPLGKNLEPVQIAANPATNKIYVTNHMDNSVAVISGTTDTSLKLIRLEVQAPYGLAVDSFEDKVYISTIDAARLKIIDASTDTLIVNDLFFPEDPPPALRMVAVDPEAHLVFVTEDEPEGEVDPAAERVFVFNTETMTFTHQITVEQDPDRGLAFDPDRRRLYVSNRRSDSVSVIGIRFKVFLPIIMKNYP